MPAKYRVRLSSEERQRLDRLVRTGRAHARTIRHAHILLLGVQSQSVMVYLRASSTIT